MKLNMLRATHRPSSAAYNCTSSLWFCIRGRLLDVVRHSAWQRPPTTRPTTFHVWKTRGCQCSFRLLMIGGVSPETCWASYKEKIIKFWYTVASCWGFLYELYYDARIHEHQVTTNTQPPTTSIRESCKWKRSKKEDEDKCWILRECIIARKQVQAFPLPSVYDRVTSDEKQWTAEWS